GGATQGGPTFRMRGTRGWGRALADGTRHVKIGQGGDGGWKGAEPPEGWPRGEGRKVVSRRDCRPNQVVVATRERERACQAGHRRAAWGELVKPGRDQVEETGIAGRGREQQTRL
ncbi:hypothetical protein GOP47_0009950, partial [Adiantum capillus-veneris]